MPNSMNSTVMVNSMLAGVLQAPKLCLLHLLPLFPHQTLPDQ